MYSWLHPYTVPSAYTQTMPSGTGYTRRRLQKSYHHKKHNSVSTLAQRVARVERSVDNAKQWAQYQMKPQGDGEGFSLTTGEWVVRPIIRPDQWQDVFQTTSEVNNSNKFNITSFRLEMFLSPKDSLISLTPKFVSVYLVSLKGATATQFLDDTDQFQRTPFDNSEGQYWQGSESIPGADISMPLLNKAVFKIHMKRQMILQNIVEETPNLDPDDDTSVTNPSFTHRRISRSFKHNSLLKTADNKKWKDLVEEEIRPVQRLYLLWYQGGFDQAVSEGGNGNTVDVGYNLIFNGRGTN